MESNRTRNQVQAPDLGSIVHERRSHPRHLDEVKVRYRDLEGWAPSAWGRTRDLSLGGLCLLSAAGIQVGSHLAVEIHITGEPVPVLALGRVLRCEQDGDFHASGIQFLWVSDEDRSNLYRLADYFRSRYSGSEPD